MIRAPDVIQLQILIMDPESPESGITGRDEHHEVFKHRTFTPMQVEKIGKIVKEKAGVNSVRYNLDAGNKLKWFAHTFINKNSRRNNVFAAWVGPNGEPIRPWKTKDRGAPKLVLVMPPGPTQWVGLEIADVYKYEPDKNQDSKAQKIVFVSDEQDVDMELYKDWYECVKYVNKVMNEDRLRFLAENIDKHEMLSEMEREIGRENTEKLYDQLVMALRTSGNNTHHAFNAFAPKRKIYRDGAKDNEGKYIATGITPEDKMTLAELRDDEGYVEHYLDSKGGAKRLNLMNIQMPDSSQLRPCEYKHIRGSGGCVSVEITIYGVYCRMEGGQAQQHSIMSGITGSQFFNNGKSATSNGNAFDITSILEENDEKKESKPVPQPVAEDKIEEDTKPEGDTEEDVQTKKPAGKRKVKATGNVKRVKVRYDEEE